MLRLCVCVCFTARYRCSERAIRCYCSQLTRNVGHTNDNNLICEPRLLGAGDISRRLCRRQRACGRDIRPGERDEDRAKRSADLQLDHAPESVDQVPLQRGRKRVVGQRVWTQAVLCLRRAARRAPVCAAGRGFHVPL
eukprot:3934132-Rhodomonas_salina.7